MGYLFETNGDASFARNGWFAMTRAKGLVEEKNRRDVLDSCGLGVSRSTIEETKDVATTDLWYRGQAT